MPMVERAPAARTAVAPDATDSRSPAVRGDASPIPTRLFSMGERAQPSWEKALPSGIVERVRSAAPAKKTQTRTYGYIERFISVGG